MREVLKTDYYNKNKVVEIDCNLKLGKGLIDERLINAKKIECQAKNQTGNWSIIVTAFEGYSLNTYSNYSIGIIFTKSIGNVIFQYTNYDDFIIDKIIATF